MFDSDEEPIRTENRDCRDNLQEMYYVKGEISASEYVRRVFALVEDRTARTNN